MEDNPYEPPKVVEAPPDRTQRGWFTSNSTAKVLCALTCLAGVCIMLAAVKLTGPKLGSLFQLGLIMTFLACLSRVVLFIFFPGK